MQYASGAFDTTEPKSLLAVSNTGSEAKMIWKTQSGRMLL